MSRTILPRRRPSWTISTRRKPSRMISTSRPSSFVKETVEDDFHEVSLASRNPPCSREKMGDRVPFDEDGDNGLVLNGKYLPEELISQILLDVDCNTLLNCQLVCVRWKTLLDTYVWRKKAEDIMSHSLHCVKDAHWTVHYAVCRKQPFERNLVKNCSGQNGVEEQWQIINQGGDSWKVETPPQGVPPLPPGVWPFKGEESCFVTSYNECSKEQIIELASEGLTSHLLDTLQPPIVVSEWYSCRWDCEGIYECRVQLLGDKAKVIDTFEYRAIMLGEAMSKWHYVSHVFKNYGPGLNKIVFRHAGVDKKFWAGHYGSKMTCASVRAKILQDREPEPDTSCSAAEKPQALPIGNEVLDDCRWDYRFRGVFR